MKKANQNQDLKAKLQNWDVREVLEYLYHLRANPSERNNRLEKIVKEYINNY